MKVYFNMEYTCFPIALMVLHTSLNVMFLLCWYRSSKLDTLRLFLYSIKFLTIPLNKVHLQKLIVAQLVKKFAALYRSPRFIIVFTRVRQFWVPVQYFAERCFYLASFNSPLNFQAAGSVRCMRLPIYRYPPYLETVSSIRNLKKRHVVVTLDPLDKITLNLTEPNSYFMFLWDNLNAFTPMICFVYNVELLSYRHSYECWMLYIGYTFCIVPYM
jgi:hypothetical protein